MFVEVDGKRYAVPGDFARLEARRHDHPARPRQQCINTGGEKVFPEEVEAALKAHPDVFDALVVGVPDERLGQRVAAVVAAPRRRGPPTWPSSRRTAAPDRRLQGAAQHLARRRDRPLAGRQARLPLGHGTSPSSRRPASRT